MRSVLRPTGWLRLAALTLLFLVLPGACGGRASDEHAPSSGPSDHELGGASAGPMPPGPGEAGGADAAFGDGGAGLAPDPAERGGNAQAGVGAIDDVPLIRSGTRPCDDARDCLGLECRGAAPLPTRICASACSEGNECLSNELCSSYEQLEATCLQRCETVEDCAHPFSCFDLLKDGVFVCVPSPWAVAWNR